ncbi:MAG: hypothetical protein LUE22_02690 [Oscillospiraceae bacterium]|nr:hypothetical protein [Oscillospiraceae bacterium]
MSNAKHLSNTCMLHYAKLVYRSCLLLIAVALYIFQRVRTGSGLLAELTRGRAVLTVIWLVFAVEMILRFFPSSIESMGCQKQFTKNYIPEEGGQLPEKRNRSTLVVAVVWIGMNAVLGVLYAVSVLDEMLMIIIGLTYSVCDMICILFFCPFQTWFMKNKCCGSCRIYNWDYAMMFTPLVFIRSVYTWSLCALALVLLIRWEMTFRLHPERFYEATNQSLKCVNCHEKLCQHKKQLRRFLRRQQQLAIQAQKDLPAVTAAVTEKVRAPRSRRSHGA